MELFNHISVAVSIILAISVAHLLSGLRDVIAPQRRDWLVTCWYAYLGYLHLLIWWSLFAVHNIANWNLGTFAITMAVPGSLYLALYTLLSDAPAAIRSWNEHFQKIRRWFSFSMVFSSQHQRPGRFFCCGDHYLELEPDLTR